MHKVLIADSTAGVPYKWPHHTNELILDRKDAEASEIMLTRIEPGEQCHRHVHTDNEQIYYIISGHGQIRYRKPDTASDTVAIVDAYGFLGGFAVCKGTWLGFHAPDGRRVVAGIPMERRIG